MKEKRWLCPEAAAASLGMTQSSGSAQVQPAVSTQGFLEPSPWKHLLCPFFRRSLTVIHPFKMPRSLPKIWQSTSIKSIWKAVVLRVTMRSPPKTSVEDMSEDWESSIIHHMRFTGPAFAQAPPPPPLRLFVFLPNSIKGIKNKAWLNLKGGCKYLCRFSGGSKEIGIKEMERAENEKRFVPFRGFKRIKGRENLTNYSSSLDTKVKVRHVKEHLAYSKITRSKIMKIWCFSSLQIVWLVSHKETEV